MYKTLIIYESKYAQTEKVVRDLALVMGPVRYCKTSEFLEKYKDYDFIVIGAGVYKEKLNRDLIEFVKENLHWLKNKNVSIFCTCSAGEYGIHYLDELKELLVENVLSADVLGGDVILEKLTKEDYESMVSFFKIVNRPIDDIKMYDLDEVLSYALRLKDIKDRCNIKAPIELVRKELREFLTNHKSCALCTGYGYNVRSTPVDYTYIDGKIYIITEGGEKFSNILRNKNVSLSIYDNYENLSNIAGMQIKGKVTIVKEKSEEYYGILEMKKVGKEQIEKIPAILNVLRVDIEKIEFLYSKFKELGYGIRQIIDFVN